MPFSLVVTGDVVLRTSLCIEDVSCSDADGDLWTNTAEEKAEPVGPGDHMLPGSKDWVENLRRIF